MAITWNYWLVALSVVVAMIGSYLALDFVGRMKSSKGRLRKIWFVAGATTMGLAIWSMHFIGMLALIMPMPMSYDPGLGALSILAAMTGSGIAFTIMNRDRLEKSRLGLGSIAMGIAIAAMHYTGMASMQMAARITYDPTLFTLSVLIAIVASAGALWLAFRWKGCNNRRWLYQKAGSAIVMGIAISGMHYTGMAAAHYIHTGHMATSGVMTPMVGTTPLADLMIAAACLFGIALVLVAAQMAGERQRAIEALEQSERQLRVLIEGVRDYALYQEDPDGRIVSWNTGGERIYGYDKNEIIGRSAALFLTPEDIQEGLLQRKLEAVARDGRFETEGWRLRKDGSRFWANIVLTALRDDDGDLIGIANITRDITEKRMADEALERYSRQLEHSNRELEQFATIASHDLQEPQRKVKFFAGVLAEMAGDRGDEFSTRLLSSVDRMQTLISDLLTLSRISRKGKAFRSVQLKEIVDQTLDDLQIRIQETGARVTAEPLRTVEADAGQMQQVFQNLVSNAIKFQRPGVQPVVRISGQMIGDLLYEITVEDNGIGFKPEYLERIFEPFERLHGRQQYPGTGMGLAIVRKIMDRHNGSVTAVSKEGEGARFILTLPVKQTAPADQPDMTFML